MVPALRLSLQAPPGQRCQAPRAPRAGPGSEASWQHPGCMGQGGGSSRGWVSSWHLHKVTAKPLLPLWWCGSRGAEARLTQRAARPRGKSGVVLCAVLTALPTSTAREAGEARSPVLWAWWVGGASETSLAHPEPCGGSRAWTSPAFSSGERASGPYRHSQVPRSGQVHRGGGGGACVRCTCNCGKA